MTHIADHPSEFKDDMLAGLSSAYGRYLTKVPGASGVMRAEGPREGKVSVVIGGGSGHYPAFAGVVGAGLADGAVVGDIFTSPSAEQAYRVGKALDGGAGVLFSFGNYAGDVMNFGEAERRLRDEGVDCRTVLVTDDIASATVEEEAERRGIAGGFTVFKIAGAAADEGRSIDEVARVARLTNARTRSFGVAFGGCTFPGQREPLFTANPDRMELGLGIHGEPGVRSVEQLTARDLASALLTPLLTERPAGAGGRVAVLLNGLGATKYEELFVLWRHVAALLEAEGLDLVLPEVGELVTSLDMAGCSLTLTWLDDELDALWQAPADTPGFRRGPAPTVAGRALGVRAASDQARGQAVPGDVCSATGALVQEALCRMLVTVREHEEELGRIDAVAGDGDHGSGMVRGLGAAVAASSSLDGHGAATILDSAADAWSDRAGGTSGILWGAALRRFGGVVGDHTPPAAEDVTKAVRASVDALQKLGRCDLGDKTMVDALHPFAEELDRQVTDGRSLTEAWTAAADVCTRAAEHTAQLTPKVGRARPLAERSVGTPDAGAVSMALCVSAVADVLNEHTPQGETR
jgi:dihydroxyacetone kinase